MICSSHSTGAPKMRVVIAPDKFKGSLSASEAARAMAQGVLIAVPEAEVDICPMADGGEGTVEVIASVAGAELREAKVRGPLPGQEVVARWAYVPSGDFTRSGEAGEDFHELGSAAKPTAVIEMAQASGLSLVLPEERDPMVATTFGTGELILEALDAGCAQVIVGAGGSATVDGGTGMAAALGYRFLDAKGREVPPGGAALETVNKIDASGRDPRVARTRFFVASDVDSPLTGPRGAARVFGPQKGATPEQVASLDRGLNNLGRIIGERGVNVLDLPGAGAAGGLGGGLVAFCGASIVSGAQAVAEAVGLPAKVAGADLVLTGEGSYDSQTARGKAPAYVAAIAREAGVPVVVVAGRVEVDEKESAIPAFCVVPGPMSLEDAMKDAGLLVKTGTARLLRLPGLL